MHVLNGARKNIQTETIVTVLLEEEVVLEETLTSKKWSRIDCSEKRFLTDNIIAVKEKELYNSSNGLLPSLRILKWEENTCGV